jgi:nicotinamidase-related amidase
MSKAIIVTNLALGSVRPYSITSCTTPYVTMENIVKASKSFDYFFIVNDDHPKDDKEFNYLPPHMIKGDVDVARLNHIEQQIQSKYVHFLTKKTLSALHNPHNKGIIFNNEYDLIVVAGFSMSADIVPTCLDLIDEKKKIAIVPSCCDDYTLDTKSKALSYLTFLGVPSIEDIV